MPLNFVPSSPAASQPKAGTGLNFVPSASASPPAKKGGLNFKPSSIPVSPTEVSPVTMPWLAQPLRQIEVAKAKLDATGLTPFFKGALQVNPLYQAYNALKWVAPKIGAAGNFLAGGAKSVIEGDDAETAFKKAWHSGGEALAGDPEKATYWKEAFVALGNKYGWEFLRDRPLKVDWVDAIGLAGDFWLDPTAWIGIGNVKHAGRIRQLVKAAEAANAAGDTRKVLEIFRKVFPEVKRLEDLVKLGKLSEAGRAAAWAGDLAPTKAEQALIGQRRLLTFAGKSLVPEGAETRFYKWYEPAVRQAVQTWWGLRHLRGLFSHDAMWGIEALGHGERALLKAKRMEYQAGIDVGQRLDIEAIDEASRGLKAKNIEDPIYEAAQVAGEAGGDLQKVKNYYLKFKGQGVIAPAGEQKIERIFSTWEKNRGAVEEAGKKFQKYYADWHDELSKRDLLEGFIEGYMKDMLPQELPKVKGLLGRALEKTRLVVDPADIALSGGKPRAAGAAFQKQRKIQGEIGQAGRIVDQFLAGYNPEKNAFKNAVYYSQQARKIIANHEMIQFVVKRWGKRVTWLKGAGLKTMKEGEEVFIPRSALYSRLAHQHLPPEFLKGQGHLIPLTNDMIEKFGDKIADVEAYVMPRSMTDYVEKFFSIVDNDESITTFNKLVDGWQNIWKRYALGTVGTQSRNMQGNLWNYFIQGVTNPAPFLKALANLVTGSPIVGQARKAGLVDSGFYTAAMEIARRSGGAPGLAQRIMAGVNPLSQDFLYIRGIKGLTNFVENWTRLAGFIHFKGQGFSDSAAAFRVIESQFDYAPKEYTRFENALRRYAFPFFSWQRNNVPYQFARLIERPGRFAVPFKAMRASESESGESPMEREYRTERMKGDLTFALPRDVQDWVRDKLNLNSKGTIYLKPDFPFADLARISTLTGTADQIISMLNPALKIIAEYLPMRISGEATDYYTGRIIRRGDLDKAPAWMQFMYQMAGKTKLGQWAFRKMGAQADRNGMLWISPFGLKAIETAVPPAMLLGRMLPPTERMVEAEEDREWAEPGRAMDNWTLRFLSSWLGVKFQLPSVRQESSKRTYRELRALEAAMKQAKTLKMAPQIPKSKKDPTLEYGFPAFKRKESPEDYIRRVRGGQGR